MKIILVLLVGYGLVSILSSYEPEFTSLYPTTPYDRCMAAHEGMPAQDQCVYLK